MYCVSARIKRTITTKEVLRVLFPVFVWMVVCFALLGIIVLLPSAIWWMGLLIIIAFFCIIPVFVFMCIIAQKIYHETFGQKDIVLTARDGAVYMDDMRLDIMYAVQDHEMYINAKCYAGKPGHQKEIFYGTIGGDAVEGFLAFCRENSVVMEVFDESEL